MQHIRNFKRITPTPEQLEEDLTSTGKTFLYYISEDGQDWYECQKKFADDTIKIMYDSNGIIRSIVAEPIMARGGSLAVSALPGPEDCSVIEIEGALPEGCSINGKWMIDGNKITSVPTDHVAEAEKQKELLMRESESVIAPLQRAVKHNMATGEETLKLEQWEIYSVELSRVDASLAPHIEWPEKPNS